MANPVFILDADHTVTSPVHIEQPSSVRPTGGVSKQTFVRRTAYVTFRVPADDELDEVFEEVQRFNDNLMKQIAAAEAELAQAASEEERQGLEQRLRELRRSVRLGQVEQLKSFIVGFPDGHGFAESDGSPCVYSKEVIGRLCRYRPVHKALWEAFLLVVNGDQKKGN